jgi:hypothetical protein
MMMDSRLCFVALPFRDEYGDAYDTVETVVDYCGLRCIRADRIPGSRRITDDIRNNIEKARIVIADLTDSNPNVFYEVGLAHGREKQIILMVQKESTVPFDLRDIRYLQYNPKNPAAIKLSLVAYIKNCISTIPEGWNRNYRPSDWKGAYIKITSLEAPASVQLGQPFEIRVTARNNGSGAHQGYFSVSFPDGVDDLRLESNIDKQVGLRGDSWGNGGVVLSYPIAEGFRYGDDVVWPTGKEYFINLTAYAKRKGLLWYYVNASSYDALLNGRRWDPNQRTLDIDQRDEDVYCGVIEVH